MIYDFENLLSDAQDLTGGTDEVSTNTIDNQAASRDIGSGAPVKISIRILEDFAGGTSVDFQVVMDTVAALSSAEVVVSTGAIPLAELVEGAIFQLTVPPKLLTQRYFGINYDKTGTFTGSCTVEAGVVLDEQTADSAFTAVTGF